jgi:ubiquinone/menaquinone biosynthesis C-methylase UbiE
MRHTSNIATYSIAGNSLEIADQHSSTEEYAQRFSGATGEWMLDVQEQAVLSMLGIDERSILDVGGGHGQIAPALVNADRSVTVLGSSQSCSQRLEQLLDTGAISFKVGNLIDLPFTERSFDSVVSLRLMSHCTAWPTLIAEMCRVADYSVIFDYPSWYSANFLTPLLFRIKRGIEGNTRTYRIFTRTELAGEFSKHGFKVAKVNKQFFFPMGIHRALKSKMLSSVLERMACALGLTWLFGSPVIIRFERVGDDDR